MTDEQLDEFIEQLLRINPENEDLLFGLFSEYNLEDTPLDE